MLSVLWTLIPTLAGIIKYVIWATTAKPNTPLPVWSPIAVVSGIILFSIFSFLAFHRVSTERDNYKNQLEDLQLKQSTKLNEVKVEPELIIGAKVKSIETYDYYADAKGEGHYGDKKIRLNVVFSPSMPMCSFSSELTALRGKFSS